MAKSPDAFRTISEVASELDVPQHVLRFWETKFTQIKPLKRAGGRRYYRPEDVELLRGIRTLLYTDGLTIKGVQKVFRDHGVRVVTDSSKPAPAAPRATLRAAVVQAPSLPAAPAPKSAEAPDHAPLGAVLIQLSEAKAILARRRQLRRSAGPGGPAIQQGGA